MLEIKAPAKINLTLEILRKRPDGYHDLCSLVQTISLADKIFLEEADNTIILGDLPSWNSEASLVAKAVKLIKERFSVVRGIKIKVEKHIPLASGLGGDSSDVAAAIKGLNRLWQLNEPLWRLAELGAELGSDVPFFFNGATALMEGRGEVVSPLAPFPKRYVVLLFPPVKIPPCKTKELYSHISPEDYTDGSRTEKLVEGLILGQAVSPSDFYNAFEAPARQVFPSLEIFEQAFRDAGAYRVHLAGAGPTLFTVVADQDLARRICRSLGDKKLEACLTETLGGAL